MQQRGQTFFRADRTSQVRTISDFEVYDFKETGSGTCTSCQPKHATSIKIASSYSILGDGFTGLESTIATSSTTGTLTVESCATTTVAVVASWTGTSAAVLKFINELTHNEYGQLKVLIRYFLAV